jgi:hypothetical protein
VAPQESILHARLVFPTFVVSMRPTVSQPRTTVAKSDSVLIALVPYFVIILLSSGLCVHSENRFIPNRIGTCE